MKSSRFVQLATFAMFVLGCAEAIFANTTYSFTPINFPGTTQPTYVYGINDNGQILGSAGAQTSFFLYTGGSFTTITQPGSTFTAASGINNSGQIVGSCNCVGGITSGFLYTGGSFTTFNFPGAIDTLPHGMNDNSQIVGMLTVLVGTGVPVYHGFLYTGGSFTVLDMPGVLYTSPQGINNSGQIVGFYGFVPPRHGFLYTGGSFTTIDVPGAISTSVIGINNRGQIVGFFQDTSYQIHGFVDTGGSFTTIDVPGASYTEVYGINDNGQIVGIFSDATGQHGYGFLATPVGIQSPPSVTCAATPNTLWPPNGKPVVVTVSGTVTPGTQPIDPGSVAYAVADSYGQVQPGGRITLGDGGRFSFGVSLISARNGDSHDGRTYTIVVGAKDVIGNLGSCSTVVTIPHDQGN